MITERGTFLSHDGVNQTAYIIYSPENPKAVIQLSHGMCEYVERYAPHAEYFCSQGFAFCGNDHAGHGGSVSDESELGYTGSVGRLVEDVALMTRLIRKKFPGLPVILLGHSMGSFVARCYLTEHAELVSAAIISGTAGPGKPTGLGMFLSGRSAKKHGDHYRDEFIKKLASGGYNKKFAADASASAWLSSDPEVWEKYENDALCNYTFTVNGYRNMFDMLGRISSRGWAESLPHGLPVLLISGRDDPVGDYGRGVEKVYNRMRRAGMSNVTVRLFEGARHEPFNEKEAIRKEVYSFITEWINGIIGWI